MAPTGSERPQLPANVYGFAKPESRELTEGIQADAVQQQQHHGGTRTANTEAENGNHISPKAAPDHQ